ncbi:MAG: hypothetical protein ACI4TX_01255 [Christensenellales bacterium]
MSEKCICGNEVSESGTYACLNCGQKITLEAGETLPPCPRCTNQSFEKVTEENKERFDELDKNYRNKN